MLMLMSKMLPQEYGRGYSKSELFRRLSKIGVDTAIDLVLLKFNDLIPALNDIALYFAAVADNSEDVLKETGENSHR